MSVIFFGGEQFEDTARGVMINLAHVVSFRKGTKENETIFSFSNKPDISINTAYDEVVKRIRSLRRGAKVSFDASAVVT